MNLSHKHKSIWWAVPRTATRALSEIFCFYDFYNYDVEGEPENIQSAPYTHTCKIPPGLENYTLITQVRNPYSWTVSNWYLKCMSVDETNNVSYSQTFAEYVTGNSGFLMDDYLKDYINYKGNKFIIRYEYLEEDIKFIPFIDLNNPEVKNNYDRVIANNVYISSYLRRDNTNKLSKWQTYYTENLADIVYNKYEFIFKTFNYNKNSWKL